jgi:ribonuclease R
VVLDEDGRVEAIRPRVRLDSHRLVEEFMICANVAAAQALEARGAPCLYRVHDQPSEDKLEALRDVLEGLGYGVPRGVLHAEDFTRILRKAAGRPEADLLAEMILRSQAQAVYSPDNIGHFGLSLRRYAHFTSPIRRYADLIVHRSLIRAYGLGEGPGEDGLDDEAAGRLAAIGDHVSVTERRAAAAERDALDRYTASFLAERVGGEFAARIAGVTRFGLFITLEGSGAGGFVPAGTLPDDAYEHDREGHALVGRRWGRVFRLGAGVRARLSEADPVTGSTVFALLEPDGADLPWFASALARRGTAPKRRPKRRG